MTKWEYYIPRLKAVLVKYINDEAELERIANEFYNDWSAASDFQAIVKKDKAPEKDKVALDEVSFLLKKAAKKLDAVGWYGCSQIHDFAKTIGQRDHSLPCPPLISNLEAKVVLAEHLESFAETLLLAGKKVDGRAASVISILAGENVPRRTSKTPQTAATHVAAFCVKIFESHSKHNAKVSTRYIGTANSPKKTEPYGPFYDFVSEAFEALEITASVEASIDRVTKGVMVQF